MITSYAEHPHPRVPRIPSPDSACVARSSDSKAVVVDYRFLRLAIAPTVTDTPNTADSMYDYQSQTSLPPIRARQQRQAGVQVQQLYESSPALAALSHHPSTTHYASQKLPHAETSSINNGHSSAVNSNGYHGHHQQQQQNAASQATSQPPASEPFMRKSPSVDSVLSMRSSSQQRRLTNALDPETAMKTYMSKLTAYERHEIFSYPQIFFVGQNARKRQGVGGGPNNGELTFPKPSR